MIERKTKTTLQSSRWTRPQQLAATLYGIWTACWTLVVGFILLTPDRVAHTLHEQGYTPEAMRSVGGATQPAGTVGILVSAIIALTIAFFSFRRVNRAFWPAMIYFTVTGLGAVWVPLRPEAHIGEDLQTLIIHAFVNDLPGLFISGWLIVGLIRYGHAWSQRTVDGVQS